MKTCKECGKEFKPLRQSYGVYCSNKCQQTYQSMNKYLSGKATNQCLRTVLPRLFGWVCSICCLNEWRGEKIPLVVDHINGNSEDSTPENVRLICCNCDALLPTYKARNKGNGRYSRRKRYKEGKSY